MNNTTTVVFQSISERNESPVPKSDSTNAAKPIKRKKSSKKMLLAKSIDVRRKDDEYDQFDSIKANLR